MAQEMILQIYKDKQLKHELRHIQFIPAAGDRIDYAEERYSVVFRIFDYNNGLVKLYCK